MIKLKQTFNQIRKLRLNFADLVFCYNIFSSFMILYLELLYFSLYNFANLLLVFTSVNY